MNHPRWSLCCALVASIAIVLTAAHIATGKVGAAASTPAPTIRIFDNRLVPVVIQIPPLSSVTWINNGHYSHMVRSTNGGWQTFSLQVGASRSVKFRTTGEFPYKVDGVLRGLVLVAAVHLGGLANP
jgi:plastocyanin